MIESLVNVKRSSKAKRIALRLDPVERVINLVIPPKMSLKTAYSFAREHEDWVIKTLKKLPPTVPFVDGKIIPVFGDKITLKIKTDASLKRTRIKQFDDCLSIETYMQDPSSRIKNHLKKIAKTGLSDLASEKADLIGKNISSIKIGDTKSRWGSCSQDGKISFSWRLIFAPYASIDYVVAHEVAHMIYMDHSKKFWELCKKLSYDYEGGKSWMKKHGNSLMRYGYQRNTNT